MVYAGVKMGLYFLVLVRSRVRMMICVKDIVGVTIDIRCSVSVRATVRFMAGARFRSRVNVSVRLRLGLLLGL